MYYCCNCRKIQNLVTGFLSDGSSSLAGNYGLADVLLALKWVQRAIDDFGGNPRQVCVQIRISFIYVLSIDLMLKLRKGGWN